MDRRNESVEFRPRATIIGEIADGHQLNESLQSSFLVVGIEGY